MNHGAEMKYVMLKC